MQSSMPIGSRRIGRRVTATDLLRMGCKRRCLPTASCSSTAVLFAQDLGETEPDDDDGAVPAMDAAEHPQCRAAVSLALKRFQPRYKI